ncbi:MAG: hypothetical protein Q4D98_07745 [Planctomycetia bacterium]|nr:hypothetical protein [Planctomycetia bacterium]
MNKPKKRRFYPLATILHAFTLVVCFVLVCFLSYKVSTQSLVSQVPTSIEGWIYVENTIGEPQKREFSLDAQVAMQIAELVDMGTYVRDTPYKVQGEFTLTLLSKKQRKFLLTDQGLRDTQGFYRQIQCDPAPIQALLLQSL